MRRIVFFGMGILECVVAAVLVAFGFQIPAADDVAHGFHSAERVTRRAADQVLILRRQVEELRRPELMQLAERLQSQTRTVAGTIKNKQINFDTVEAMRDALGEIADTLDSLTRNVAPAAKDGGMSPELRATLARSAGVLRTSSKQLSKALEHRDDYEETMRQSVALAELFASTLPLLTEQLDGRLAEEEHALNELAGSLEEVRACLPVYATTSVHVMQSGRLLAWLGASLAALHAGYLILSASLGRRYSL